jgi:Zn-finger nucleic acid-binding protein
MNCPNCNVPLAMSEKQGVEIDYCPQCRGIWLDRGELNKIIELVASDVQNEFHPPHNIFSNNHQTGNCQFKKKKYLLNEIFD